MTLDFNTDPYNDDYAESDKFYKILFRPSYPVQARELTQLQTILQTQIARHGSAIFKQGAMVIPGQTGIYNNVSLIKLQNTYAGNNVDSYINEFLGQTITGSSGVTATVFFVSPATSTDPHILYVKYTNSGTTSTTKAFVESEVITAGNGFQATLLATTATGAGSFAGVEQGVYFINGQFVLVEKQTIILDKFGVTPSYRIGLSINESIVTPEQDEKLLDNAQGSYNYAAPGAHRHFIELLLEKRELDSSEDSNFVTLSVVDNGVVLRDTRTTEYSDLEKTLARRTFDESGSYTVRDFEIDVREYRNNDRGAWATATPYLAGDIVTSNGKLFTCITQGVSNVAPDATLIGTLVTDGLMVWEYTPTPLYNRGIFTPKVSETTLAAHQANEAKLAIGLEPGKAYVQGYEIEKIATEYVSTPKSREINDPAVNNAVVTTNVGNFVIIANSSSIPVTFGLVNLYDSFVTTPGTQPVGVTTVGTARVRGIEYHSAGFQKLFLFDVKMNTGYNFDRQVKSIGTTTNSFTANISGNLKPLVGSISTSGATMTGVGTSFVTDLIPGDIVFLPGTSINVQILSITSQTVATLVAAPAAQTGQAFGLITTRIVEPLAVDAIYPLPYYATSSIADVQYSVYEVLTNVVSTGGGAATFTYTGVGTLSSAGSQTNYTFTSGNATFTPTTINIVGNQVQITGAPVSATIQCMANIQYTGNLGVTEKVKTLSSQSTIFNTAAAANAILTLDRADGFKLARVEMDTSVAFGGAPTWTNTTDISDRYDFFNGQTESYYGPAYLKLKGSYAPPTNPIRVTFQYFTHGTGHFFSKNSYAAIDYKLIPKFGDFELRDALDFRPRSDDGVTITGTLPVKRGVNITADVQYYLSRKDLLAMDSAGRFYITEGESSLTPKEPSLDANSMVLYGLTYQPYTFGAASDNVLISKTDNKRYTMRDIGKLEKRISNLEYYTSLSLLEQETASLSIRDSAGLERYKNGFIVDSFKGNGIGDANSPDYVAATDPLAGELRPYFTMENVNLIEQAVSEPERLASNYKLYGDVITLPLDPTTPHVVLVDQPYGTRTENVNPFAVFTFLGDVSINPASDDWFEVTRLPDIVQSVEGNYSQLTSTLASQGVLGTVWNGWQTQWTGAPVLTNSQLTSVAMATVGRWTAAVVTRTDTYATTVGQTRSGTTTSVIPTYTNSTIGDRVVSSQVIPYIRSRNVLVQVKRLKPNSRFYPFFDGVKIDAYVTAATRITYTLTSSKTFDVDSNVGSNQIQAARLLNGDSQVCLNKGDVITTSNGATAVVVGSSISGGVRTLDVVNIKGTLTVGNTMSGSVQDAGLNVATGTILSVAPQATLVSNNNGDLNFLFNIPNTDSVAFRTGTRELLLLDQPQNDVNVTSRARGSYFAEGIMETKQATILSVRNGEVSTSTVGDSRTIIETSDRVITAAGLAGNGALALALRDADGNITTSVTSTGAQDPLAQTFYIQNTGGAFLSKIDIFFAKKDANIPVTMELREVVNGYPGVKVLPFSRVTLKPEQVNISSNNVMLNGVLTPAADTPTTFTFQSPVYVQDGAQYAIVLMAETQNYIVWISQMGETVPGSERTVSEQPNLGSLFKSQNASTWTPDQSQDLMFKVWRAKFNVGTAEAPTQGLVRFVNDQLPLVNLETNPFEARSGASTIRIHQPSHGLVENGRVTIHPPAYSSGVGITTTAGSTAVTSTTSFATQGVLINSALYTVEPRQFVGIVQSVAGTSITLYTGAAVSLVNQPFLFLNTPVTGIIASEIYRQHTSISAIQADSFVITCSGTSSVTGYFGGSGNRSSRYVQYDVFQPVVQALNFPETATTYGVWGLSGKSLNSNQTPFVGVTNAIPVAVNDNNVLSAPNLIANRETEVALFGSEHSLWFDVGMTSINDALSPIIDTQRISFITVSNRVNNPTEANMNVATLDNQFVVTNNLIQFDTAGRLFSVDGPTGLLLASIPIGRYITITGASNAANNATYLVIGTSPGNGIYLRNATTNSTTTVAQASGVSTIVVTQRVSMVNEIAAIGSSSISKYVTQRINLENSSTYLRIRMAVMLPTEAAVEVYYRLSASGSTTDLSKVPYTLVNPDTVIPYSFTAFTDVNFTLTNLVPFDGISLKIVMKSTNSSMVPRIKDLRVIACA
jgi:hypothetical protein